jgi:hypothetical protein
LREVIEHYLPTHGNDQIPVVDALLLLGFNLSIGKQPLYELPAWCAGPPNLSVRLRIVRF